MSVAPMHEAVLVAKPPHSSAAVSAPQPGFHIPPSSMSHPPPTMVSPHPTLPQERPQAQMQVMGVVASGSRPNSRPEGL